jgi:hypothetical protein
VREGHDVTLFASGDSKTAAHLVPCVRTRRDQFGSRFILPSQRAARCRKRF